MHIFDRKRMMKSSREGNVYSRLLPLGAIDTSNALACVWRGGGSPRPTAQRAVSQKKGKSSPSIQGNVEGIYKKTGLQTLRISPGYPFRNSFLSSTIPHRGNRDTGCRKLFILSSSINGYESSPRRCPKPERPPFHHLIFEETYALPPWPRK